MHNCKSSNWRYSKGLVIILQVKGKSHCKCSEINYLKPTFCLWLLCALRFHRYFMTPLRLFDFYFPYIECSEWNVQLHFNYHICIFLCFIYTINFYSFLNHLSFSLLYYCIFKNKNDFIFENYCTIKDCAFQSVYILIWENSYKLMTWHPYNPQYSNLWFPSTNR